MKVLYLDPIGGISGDMTLGALVDLGVPLEVLQDQLQCLGVEGWSLKARRLERHGIAATKVDVVVNGEDHPHRAWSVIRKLIDDSDLADPVRRLAQDTFEQLARAEAKVHGVSVEEVQFHEVGAIDAIIDICGMAVGITHLGVEQVYAGPPPLGTGMIDAAHGRLPVPAPATLEILRGIPVAQASTPGELTTPTGAAILATLARGRVGPMPAMTPDRIGYGAGDASWPDRPNLLRAVVGETTALDSTVWVVEANLDDMSPEFFPSAMQAILDAGALDVYAAPITMKKGRPGHLLSALCRASEKESVVRAILRETTTFGVRLTAVQRVELEREHLSVETSYGPVRMKIGRLSDEVLTASPEFEDCRAIAEETGAPLKAVYAAAIAAYERRE